MNLIDFALIALVAIVCGTIAQLTSGFSKGGWIVNLIIGFFGSLAGVFISRMLNAPVIYDIVIQSTKFPVIYCIVGAALSLAAIGFIIKPGRG